MLYFLTAWSILAVLTWIIGFALLSGLQAGCLDRVYDRTLAAVWLGTVVLANGLLFISLGLSLSLPLGLVITAGALLLFAWLPVRAEARRMWSITSVPVLLALVGWAIFIALYMTRRVTWFDTGFYHFGAIRWLSEFGTVPGLALLLDNLGFTSSWFALAAPLNTAGLASHVSAVTNGYILLIATWYGIVALWRWITGKARITDKFWVLFLGFVMPALTLTTFLSAILLSSSPDIPVIFLTGAVAWSILAIANSPDSSLSLSQELPSNQWDATLIPLVLAGGTVAIKLSALPLLPIAFLFYWSRRPLHLPRFIVGGIVALLLLTPPMTVSVVTSGCPLYPSSALCLDLPWRLSAEQAHNATEYIRGWDRWFGSPPDGANPFLWRFWQWLQFAQLNLIMLLLLVSSIPLMGLTFKSAKKQGILGTPWLFGLGFLGMTFIMLRAPMIRFGLGYFVMIPAIAIAILGPTYLGWLNWKRWQQFSDIASPNHASYTLLAGLGLVVAISLTRPAIQSRLLLPPAMPTADIEVKRSHDVEYVSPTGDRGQCWDAPLPCAPGDDKNIRLRNPSRGLDAGFIIAEDTVNRE